MKLLALNLEKPVIAKTYADMLEEEEVKKEAEVKKEDNRINRENIWKKRTVSN